MSSTPSGVSSRKFRPLDRSSARVGSNRSSCSANPSSPTPSCRTPSRRSSAASRLRLSASGDGQMSMSMVDRITPWALTASPPIRAWATPEIFNSRSRWLTSSGAVTGWPPRTRERARTLHESARRLARGSRRGFLPRRVAAFRPSGLVDLGVVPPTSGARKIRSRSLHALHHATDNEKPRKSGAFPVRPRGLEPPRTIQSTRPSTSSPGCKNLQMLCFIG
jgi:hypothetical protein